MDEINNQETQNKLTEINDGDICLISVQDPNYTIINAKGSIIKLSDNKSILFNQERIIDIKNITNIILKEKLNINFDARRLKQEDVKKICQSIYNEFYIKRLNYLFSMYKSQDTMAMIFSDETENFIVSILNKITNYEIGNSIQLTKNRAQNYHLLLIAYLSDNIPCQKIIDVIDVYVNKYKELLKKPISWFYEDNKETFIKIALEELFTNIESNTITTKDKETIKNELISINDIDKIIKLLFTFTYTNSAISMYTQIDFVDYTFISVSCFKLTEIIFNQMLNKYWSNKKITPQKNTNNDETTKANYIDLSQNNLVLGKMKFFLDSTDNEIKQHLNKKCGYVESLNEKLGIWIDKKRNTYLHKEILNKKDLDKSIKDSFEILCLIILVVSKY